VEGRPEAPGTGALRSVPIRASRRARASAAMVVFFYGRRATSDERRRGPRMRCGKEGAFIQILKGYPKNF
jgi:hypothetical protein